MAGNNSIQILRGTSAAIANSSEKLLDGQMIYNTDKNYLTIGANGNKQVSAEPIVCRKLIAYQNDGNGEGGVSGYISSDMNILYSIDYDSYNGLQINNTGAGGPADIVLYGSPIKLFSSESNVIIGAGGATISAENSVSALSNGNITMVAPTLNLGNTSTRLNASCNDIVLYSSGVNGTQIASGSHLNLTCTSGYGITLKGQSVTIFNISSAGVVFTPGFGTLTMSNAGGTGGSATTFKINHTGSSGRTTSIGLRPNTGTGAGQIISNDGFVEHIYQLPGTSGTVALTNNIKSQLYMSSGTMLRNVPISVDPGSLYNIVVGWGMNRYIHTETIPGSILINANSAYMKGVSFCIAEIDPNTSGSKANEASFFAGTLYYNGGSLVLNHVYEVTHDYYYSGNNMNASYHNRTNNFGIISVYRIG